MIDYYKFQDVTPLLETNSTDNQIYMTITFFIFLLLTSALCHIILRNKQNLIDRWFYLISISTFIIIAAALFGFYILSPWSMAIMAGIFIGIWGMVLFHSQRLKSERKMNGKKK